MRNMFVRIFALVLIFGSTFQLLAQDDPFEEKKKDKPLVVVSGIKTGSYHQLVTDIVDISEQSLKVQNSEGSINNYNILLNNPDVDLVFIQYDVLLKAKMYDIKHKQHNAEKIQVVMPMGVEEIHLITRTKSDIYAISDLAGKKVGVGIPSKEGTSVTAGLIKTVTATTWDDVNISFDSAFAALVNGNIDAFFYVGYAPAQKLKELMPTFNQIIRLVPIKDKRLSKFHVKTVIPASTYPWLHYDVETFAVRSFLVSNTKYESEDDKDKIEKMLTSIMENADDMAESGHPKWKEIKFETKGINWGVHPVTKKLFDKQ